MIERNKNPADKAYNILFGLASIVDGVIRVLSLGLCHTYLPLTVSRWQAKRAIKRNRIKAVDSFT